MCAPTVTMVQIICRRRGEGTPLYGYYIKMVSVVVCDMVFVRSGAPRLYPGAPSLALRAIHLAATYGNMRYQMEPAGAVCSHQTNELRVTVIPQRTLSCPSGNSPCAAPSVDLTACVAVIYPTLRICGYMDAQSTSCGRKNPLSRPYSLSSLIFAVLSPRETGVPRG